VGDRHGLILDYGGVLTASPFASFEAFCAVEGLAPDAVRSLFRDDPAARDLLARLETGHLTAAEFEPARELGMATVLHRGDARATLAEIDALLK
jgi:hypothetical protein